MTKSSELERAAAAIENASSLALACHVGPDGDALGSMLAFHHLCRSQSRLSVASWSEPFIVAPHYNFLPGLDTTTKPEDFPTAPSVMVTFDCGSLGRLGDLAGAAVAARDDGELIVIDHHVSNEWYGTINVIDAEAAATAVLVRQLAARLGWPLTRSAATCLYTGLVTDTGRFQYENTTPEVFRLAQELVGFDLLRAELDRDLRFVATWVTNFDLDGFDVDLAETEGLIDLVRRTAEADVACVCKETPDGIRVSLRSVSDVDVSAIAGRFGGGGHRFAAGFTAPYPVTDVIAGVKAELRRLR